MSEKVKVVTPVGELYYCRISGQGKENYNKDGYVYTATIFLKGEDAENLKAKIHEVLGALPKGKTLKSSGYREVWKNKEGNFFVESDNRTADEDEGDEKTDITQFTFSTNTTFEDGRKAKVDVYDSGKNKDGSIRKPRKVDLGDRGIGNGSRGAISGALSRNESARDVSVSLYLRNIQLVKFIEYSGDAGFEAQEDGEFDGVEDDGMGDLPEDKSETKEAAAPKKAKAKPRI